MQYMRGLGMRKVQKVSWLTVTIVFLSVFFLSLFYMPDGMGMSDKMSGCPFMSHEEVVCSMNTFDHISAWKSSFIATAPPFVLLLLTIATAIIVLSVAPNLLFKQRYNILVLTRHVRERTYSFSYRPLQELFSSGILHPKLF